MTNNDMKKTVLGNIDRILMELNQQINIIDSLDNVTTSSGFLDLHDQIHTMYRTLTAFEEVMVRAVDIVPSKQDKNNV